MNTTKQKRVYMAPTTELVHVQTESLLEVLSMGISTTPADGGGDAKHGFFDEQQVEEEKTMNRVNPWECRWATFSSFYP